MRSVVAVLAFVTGCHVVFDLEPVQVPPAPPDAPADVSIDAPTVLSCTSSPIVLRPTGVFSETWADHFPADGTHVDKVIDAAGADDDATYIASKIDGQLDLFTHLPLDSSVKIDSVTFSARARLEEATTSAQVGVAFINNATLNWDDVTLTSSWSNYSSGLYVTNPVTNQPWTHSDINDMAIGVRKAYAAYRVRVTQIWATIACH